MDKHEKMLIGIMLGVSTSKTPLIDVTLLIATEHSSSVSSICTMTRLPVEKVRIRLEAGREQGLFERKRKREGVSIRSYWQRTELGQSILTEDKLFWTETLQKALY